MSLWQNSIGPVPWAFPSLPYFYLFIFSHSLSPAPSLTFLCHISHSTSLLIKSQTHLEARPHFCQAAASQSPEQVCVRSSAAQGVLYNTEEPESHSGCCGVSLLVHLSGLKAEALSHRDVWRRMLSHSSAREVFIRLLFLNWGKRGGQPFVWSYTRVVILYFLVSFLERGRMSERLPEVALNYGLCFRLLVYTPSCFLPD